MNATVSVLLLQGDAEASLLADGDVALQAIFPEREIVITRLWATRPDWLASDALVVPAHWNEQGEFLDGNVAEQLREPHRLVVISLLSAVALPAYQHASGARFVAHRNLMQALPAAVVEDIQQHCQRLDPMQPEAAIAAIEPVVEALLANGVAVAIVNAFRHVKEALAFQSDDTTPSLRERVRRLNLLIAQLSQRTGCFVLDVDRPLAQVGGATLQADCFGGNERAAELVLDEFAALALDALPDCLMPLEIP